MSLRVWLAFLLLCVIWGIPYFFIKVALVELPPTWIAFGRITFGAALLLPIAWHRGALREISSHWKTILTFALIELVAPFYLIALGERWISSALTGVLLALVPMLVLLIAPLLGVKEHLSGRRLIGLAIGLIGVVVLLGVDAAHGWQQWLGVGCVLIAAIGYAIGPLILQRHLPGADLFGSVAAALGVGALVLLIPALLTLPEAVPSTKVILSVGVLGLVSTAMGLLLFAFIISKAGAARASVVTYVNPAIAVLLGVLLLDEHFGTSSSAGLAMILLGSWLATSAAKAAH